MKTLIVTLILSSLSTASVYAAEYSAFKRGKGAKWQKAWTQPALKGINANLMSLKPSDIETYCPGYGGASKELKENCWLRLVSGIAAFESGFKPGAVGDRWNPPSNGGPAYGLMQIQARECKGRSPTTVEGNLACGTAMMARLIKRDGVITGREMAGPGPRPNGGKGKARGRNRGLARGGWSTMMEGMAYVKPLGKYMKVGHRAEIQAGVKGYRDHKTGTLAARAMDKITTVASRRRGLLGVTLV